MNRISVLSCRLTQRVASFQLCSKFQMLQSRLISKMIRDCRLICPNNTHDPISLPDGKPVLIGRSPQTRIIDPRCSRHQLEVTADWKTEKVTVKQLGSNSSAMDGIELERDRLCRLQPGATIYVLAGQYPQQVEFIKQSSSSENDQKAKTKKSDSGGQKSKQRQSSDSESSKDAKTDKLLQNGGKGLKVKRKSSIGDDNKNAKKLKLAEDSDDDDEIKNIEEKLKKLKEDAKQRKVIANMSSSSPENEKPKKVINNSREDKSEGEPAKEAKWESIEDKLFVYTGQGLMARRKIAGFDIDGTIITTQSGRVFPKDHGDWRILYPEIPGKLKKLHNEGYKIVMFTNQKGVAKGKTNIDDLKLKFTTILKKMGVIAQILISTGEGVFRKPVKGMWQFLRDKANDGVTISVEDSFYVGDAAGRPEKWEPGKKKDFSCSDRLFALNVGLKFHTPEEFFLGKPKAKFNMPEFDPRKAVTSSITDPADAKIVSLKQEVIIFSGCPGSGKSSFAKTHLVPKGYVHVNRDTLGTWQKCASMCSTSLKEGKSIVIDNTNPDVESRARYIEVARKQGVPCRCFVFNTTNVQCRHNERFRQIVDKAHKPIGDVIIHSFKNKFKEPKLSEGFQEIVHVNCVPKFTNPKHERLYKQFLLEK